MACSTDFIESICDSLAPLGEVRSRNAPLMADAECGCPYQGAKEAYILEFADRHKALKVVETIWEYLPFPKSKKK